MNWTILYDRYSYAVEMTYSAVMDYMVNTSINCMKLQDAGRSLAKENNIIYIGACGEYPAPKDGYRLKSLITKWGTQVVILTGCDLVNTVYAAVDFKEKYLVKAMNADVHNGPYFFRRPFVDLMPEIDVSFTPVVKMRSLWTWGYVIYDYKRYIDNMVMLKLNCLILWNDFPPENAKQIVDYAHERGVKIIWGYSWGWDTNCAQVDVKNLEKISDEAIRAYQEQYADLGGDGIYVQAFTESVGEKIGDVIVAEAVTDLVNMTAKKLLELYPDLYIQFGLHAPPVKNRLEYIANIDPRVLVFWEDCGAFPYSYIPKNVKNFDETVAFTEKLKRLRNGGFGAMFKGMTCLDWTTFEHRPGTFILGAASKGVIKERTAEKQKFWKYIQAYWISNAKYLYEMVKVFDKDDVVGALVEDGMLESGIWFPVALYAEMLWDTESTVDEILSRVALMPDVKFAQGNAPLLPNNADSQIDKLGAFGSQTMMGIIGRKIYGFRKKQDLSQNELALLLHISPQSVSKWENGIAIPSVENIILLAEIFDVTLDELLKE